jgi:hypothetical protein
VSNSPDTFSYKAEIGRKTLHLIALIIPFGMWWLGAPLALYVVGASALIAVTADLTRAHSPTFNDWIRWIFGPLMRADELPEVGERVTFSARPAFSLERRCLRSSFRFEWPSPYSP